MKSTKSHQNLKSKIGEITQTGDLLHLPSGVRLWKWDKERTVPTEAKVTELPTVALYAESTSSSGDRIEPGIRVYCDGEYWWVKESDVFKLEPRQETEK